MKLYATIKNERGGKKSTGDDTRILVELTYKNKVVGELGLYVIRDWPKGEELGYRIVWRDETTTGEIGGVKTIKEEEQKGKDLKGKHIMGCTGLICSGYATFCKCNCHKN